MDIIRIEKREPRNKLSIQNDMKEKKEKEKKLEQKNIFEGFNIKSVFWYSFSFVWKRAHTCTMYHSTGMQPQIESPNSME